MIASHLGDDNQATEITISKSNTDPNPNSKYCRHSLVAWLACRPDDRTSISIFSRSINQSINQSWIFRVA